MLNIHACLNINSVHKLSNNVVSLFLGRKLTGLPLLSWEGGLGNLYCDLKQAFDTMY